MLLAQLGPRAQLRARSVARPTASARARLLRASSSCWAASGSVPAASTASSLASGRLKGRYSASAQTAIPGRKGIQSG